MRIVYLVESVAQIWGGVKIALDGANELAARGHDVTVLSKSEAPTWCSLRCAFGTVSDFEPENILPADLVIGTYWTTVPFAVQSGKGIPVHLVQGYEGMCPENRHIRQHIEAVYRLPEPRKVTISPHLTQMMQDLFGHQSLEIPNMIDHRIMFPKARPGQPGQTLRVGLVGPYQIEWKDIPTGLEACAMAYQAGLDLELVRITNTEPHADEKSLPYPVEWHQQVPPHEMGNLYRSMDVLVASSYGAEEGFFLPAVEAMACGVPCVLTDIPCFRNYGEGPYALMVPPRDPQKMAEAIVLASSHPEVRSRLRAQGLQVAMGFSIQRHTDALEDAFTKILGRRVAGAREQTEFRAGEMQSLSQNLARTLAEAADIYAAAGSYQQAESHVQAALCIKGQDPELLELLGYVRYLAGDDIGALEIYDGLLAAGHETWQTHSQRGRVLITRGDNAAAVGAFEKALALSGENPEMVNNLGVAYYRTGNLDKARSCFERALQLSPGDQDAAANLQKIR